MPRAEQGFAARRAVGSSSRPIRQDHGSGNRRTEGRFERTRVGSPYRGWRNFACARDSDRSVRAPDSEDRHPCAADAVVFGVAAAVLPAAVTFRTGIFGTVREVPRARVVHNALDDLAQRRDEAVHEDDEESTRTGTS
jgi:hypothetical protein